MSNLNNNTNKRNTNHHYQVHKLCVGVGAKIENILYSCSKPNKHDCLIKNLKRSNDKRSKFI